MLICRSAASAAISNIDPAGAGTYRYANARADHASCIRMVHLFVCVTNLSKSRPKRSHRFLFITLAEGSASSAVKTARRASKSAFAEEIAPWSLHTPAASTLATLVLSGHSPRRTNTSFPDRAAVAVLVKGVQASKGSAATTAKLAAKGASINEGPKSSCRTNEQR
jgi:hypothetical protein